MVSLSLRRNLTPIPNDTIETVLLPCASQENFNNKTSLSHQNNSCYFMLIVRNDLERKWDTCGPAQELNIATEPQASCVTLRKSLHLCPLSQGREAIQTSHTGLTRITSSLFEVPIHLFQILISDAINLMVFCMLYWDILIGCDWNNPSWSYPEGSQSWCTRHLALVLSIVFSIFSLHHLVTGGKSEKNRSAKRTSESQHSLKL